MHGPEIKSRAGNFEIQSTPRHVAIVMDGNRRWARSRGLPDSAGHSAGARTLENLLPRFAETPATVLTLFGLAAANWQRSRRELTSLLEIIRQQLQRAGELCAREDIAIEVIGRRDRLGDALLTAIEATETRTRGGCRRLRLALDYSSRGTLLEVARRFPRQGDATAFRERLGAVPDVDLLIRTGGEQRLSDFLLWECAHAEFVFFDCYWPDFDAARLEEALQRFAGRSRRFGR
ncbi:MAG: polyprenyl diphosphate synthase [Pseudomonadota bacterium]